MDFMFVWSSPETGKHGEVFKLFCVMLHTRAICSSRNLKTNANLIHAAFFVFLSSKTPNFAPSGIFFRVHHLNLGFISPESALFVDCFSFSHFGPGFRISKFFGEII